MKNLNIQILRNALFGGGARMISLLVAIPMTAYLVSRLGMERFGLWAMVSVLAGTVGMLDLSLRTGFVKHLAEDMAHDARESINEIVSFGFIFYLGFALLAALLIGFGADPLLDFFHVGPDLRPEARWVLFLGMARVLSGHVLSVFASLCDARQRMDITNSIGLASLAVSTLLTIVFIEQGWGLIGLGAAQLTGALLFYVACIPVARHLAGPFRISIRHLTRRTFKRLFGFSMRLHISSLCGTINTQLDKILLARWTTLAFVGSYELGARLAANAGSLHPYLAGGLLPASSHLSAAGDLAKLRRVYRTASVYLFLIGIPLFAFLAAYAPDLMTAWLGRPHPEAARILLILSAGFMVNTLSNGMAFICQGIGEPGIQMRQSFLQMTVNLVLSILLLVTIGPYGAPLGTSIALMVGATYFIVIFHRRIGVRTADYLKATVGIPSLVSLAAAPGIAFSFLPAATRSAALIRIAGGGALLGGAVLVAGHLVDRSGWSRLRTAWRHKGGSS